MKDINAEALRSRLIEDLAKDPGILILAYPYARTWKDLTYLDVQAAWERVSRDECAAVYVHIPFCRRKCTFCDFLAYYGRPQDEIERYIELLIREVRDVARIAGHVGIRTVHLGGGTPSLLLGDQIRSLLDSIGSNLNLRPDAQVTMEVFPDSFVTRQHLAEWRRAGINRLSLGFQFFDDKLKTILNRTDYVSDNLRLFQEARDVGYEDINIDLMCGLPEQSPESWRASIIQTVNLSPTHICVFPVSVRHPGIPLFKNQTRLPAPNKTRRMYDEAAEILIAAGYERTTRHNFARSSFEYRYERMIAELRPLIGLGAHSISYARDCIYKNHSDLSLYASSVADGQLPIRSGHLFEEAEQPNNYAVRQIEYLSLSGDDFKRNFGLTLESALRSGIDLLREFGLARMAGDDLLLSEDGVYFTSAVKRVFFHQSAWDRLHKMRPEEFKIERGFLPVLITDSRRVRNQPAT